MTSTDQLGKKVDESLSYFTTVDHTKKAHAALGTEQTLAVVQIVAKDDDRDVNRATAQQHSSFCLGLQNYVRNLRETGFPDLTVDDERARSYCASTLITTARNGGARSGGLRSADCHAPSLPV